MLVKKMKCPHGCEESNFLESTKTVIDPNAKLLLDSNSQQGNVSKNIKVYTCNCCHNSFEIPETNSNGKMVL